MATHSPQAPASEFKATPSAIHFDGVSKQYDQHWALRNINLHIVRGETTAIVGLSGCGKSTLLRCVNGMVKPDSGSLSVRGSALDYSRLPLLRRSIGYAVQGTGLFPHLRVRDNILLLGQLQNWDESKLQQRLYEVLQLFDLAPSLLDRYPHELSGGQQQRVGLCRAVLLQADILLLDEPFAALDPITRSGIHQQLIALQRREATTVLLVTHDMQEAMALASNLVVMRDGEISGHYNAEELSAMAAQKNSSALLQYLLESSN